MKNIAIILASGNGSRSGLDIPKQFVKIAGKPVIEYTISTFENHTMIDEIIIVTNKDYIEDIREIIKNNKWKKITSIVIGGGTRQESSFNALQSIKDKDANVLIHDAVRPFVSDEIITNCVVALEKYDAIDVAISSADTIINIDDNNIIQNIPKRKYYKRGQTPQAFKLQTILKAHQLAKSDKNVEVTDDCGLILKYNLGQVYVVEGDNYNMKITYPIDVAIADKLFQLKNTTPSNIDCTLLKGKTIVIFGGTKGIGKAISEFAQKYGANVFACSKTTDVDIRNYEKVAKYLKQINQKTDKIDYVINTAGILRVEEFELKTEENISEEIETNYIGCINIAKASFEYLKGSKGGLMFFTSSSYTRGRANYAIYSSTKAAIVNLTQALSEEWAKYDIKVNVINPQRTATQMRLENFGKEDINTLLPPDTVAQKALEVALSELTGQIIDVRKT